MQPVQESSLEDLVKQMATNNIQFQENVSATMHDLQTQIGQLATMSKGSGQIPSQTIFNPQKSVSDITLRSGKEQPQQQSIKLHSEFSEITSKLDNLGTSRNLRRRSKTFLLTDQPNSAIYNVKNGLKATVAAHFELDLSLLIDILLFNVHVGSPLMLKSNV
ncbi:hypothetical protein CR513_01404, partial [Mucuna pruriens]